MHAMFPSNFVQLVAVCGFPAAIGLLCVPLSSLSLNPGSFARGPGLSVTDTSFTMQAMTAALAGTDKAFIATSAKDMWAILDQSP